MCRGMGWARSEINITPLSLGLTLPFLHAFQSEGRVTISDLGACSKDVCFHSLHWTLERKVPQKAQVVEQRWLSLAYAWCALLVVMSESLQASFTPNGSASDRWLDWEKIRQVRCFSPSKAESTGVYAWHKFHCLLVLKVLKFILVHGQGMWMWETGVEPAGRTDVEE